MNKNINKLKLEYDKEYNLWRVYGKTWMRGYVSKDEAEKYIKSKTKVDKIDK